MTIRDYILLAVGTSEGAEKGWDTRGRSVGLKAPRFTPRLERLKGPPAGLAEQYKLHTGSIYRYSKLTGYFERSYKSPGSATPVMRSPGGAWQPGYDRMMHIKPSEMRDMIQQGKATEHKTAEAGEI